MFSLSPTKEYKTNLCFFVGLNIQAKSPR